MAADAKRAAATRDEVASGREDDDEEEGADDEEEFEDEAKASRIRSSLETAAGGPAEAASGGITPEGLALASPGSLMPSFS